MNIHEKKAKYDELIAEAEALRTSVIVYLPDWMICPMFHCDEVLFSIGTLEKCGSDWATLTIDSIKDLGSYTEEELQPVLKAIQDYIAGEEK